MDDSIFDEADEILGEDSSTDEEKSFNESELQDIMSEIEDLEKEFEADTTMSLQEQIDAELESVTEEVATEVVSTEPVAQVLSFEKATPKTTTTKSSGGEVSFAAHGQMKLNLDFKIGEDTATLSIDPVKGLVVMMTGVELCINEVTGCTVTMDNGMNFTIPLSAQDKSLKKKAV